MRHILLVTLAGLGLTAGVQAIAGQVTPNTNHDCELAALPKELGSAVCAPYDPVESTEIQGTQVTPHDWLVTPSIGDALAQTRPQPGPSAITVHIVQQGTAPQILVREGEQVPTLIEVSTSTEGNVTECRIVKGSGSGYLDRAACDWAKGPNLKLLLPRTR
jgi:hypothetical protein